MNIHENLRQIGNLIKKQVNKDFESLGLTCAQAGILMFILINKDKNINQRVIEKEFNLSNPTVNGVLNRLESKSLIKRINSDTDKRIKNIVPLKKAEDFMEQVKNKKEELESSMIKNISTDELNTFCNVLKKVSYNLKENKNEGNI